ncbi:MAG: DMT family transporter [Chlamydiia bacterium]|nr:DMT family transporter [Chlamydiia bacterium]
MIVVFVTLMWALCFPLISTGLSGTSPLWYATLRSLIAGLSLLVPSILFGGWPKLSRKIWLLLIFFGFTYSFMGFGGMFLGGKELNPGIATVLANTQPLMAATMAYFFLSEKLNTIGFLGFSGILVIAWPAIFDQTSIGSIKGIEFILIGALGTAIGNILLKKLTNKAPIFFAIGFSFIFGAFFLASAALSIEGALQTQWNSSFAISLLILSIPGTAIATACWYYLLERNPLTRLNAFSFLTPGFGLAIGVIFFRERLSMIELGGVFLIVIGIYLISKRNVFKESILVNE